MGHKSCVYYTYQDDGVWIDCSCRGFDACLGSMPSVEDVVAAWNIHLKQMGVEDDTSTR